jgi:hypothetical protein
LNNRVSYGGIENIHLYHVFPSLRTPEVNFIAATYQFLPIP